MFIWLRLFNTPGNSHDTCIVDSTVYQHTGAFYIDNTVLCDYINVPPVSPSPTFELLCLNNHFQSHLVVN